MEADTFRLDGEYWTVAYRGEVCHLRDTRGLRALALLLRQPGRPLAATALASARTPEQARLNATRAIKLALAKITRHMPALAAHLRATVRTGAHCIYDPDPRLPIVWTTDDARRGDRDEPSSS